MDICITGAAQNTLQHIDLTLPAGKIVALVGPSGSGKSTLARDTLFAESRRRFLDCLSVGARRLLTRMPHPKAERIDGLPPALCLEQGMPPASSRAVLGSITEVLDYLRVLYAAIGCPHDPVTGERLTRLSPDEIVNAIVSHPEGTRLTVLAPLATSPTYSGAEHTLLSLRKAGYLRLRVNGVLCDLDDPESDLLPEDADCELVIDRLVLRPGVESRLADSVQSALRIHPDELRVLFTAENDADPSTLPLSYYTCYRNEATGFSLPALSPEMFSYFSPRGACAVCAGRGQAEKGRHRCLCPACHGLRLNPTALAVTLSFADAELSFADFCEKNIAQNRILLDSLTISESYAHALQPTLESLRMRLDCLLDLGLGYLTLSRPTYTLSCGELQRARLAGQLGGGLSGVLYILDEPTIGLHPTETQKLLKALRALQHKGNTILLAEHDPDILRAVDFLVEMGPGSGPEGGRILTMGTPQQLMDNPDSPTGAWLAGRRTFSVAPRPPIGKITWATLRHADARNLRDVTFSLPLGAFSCLSGPSGSGKSTLVYACLLPALAAGQLEGAQSINRAVVVDQRPIGASQRSTPASASGLLDILRSLYAQLPLSRMRGYTPARFSPSVRGGRCERCGGTGLLPVDKDFPADMLIPCDVCCGTRYNRETLEVTWRGKSIAAALEQSVDAAAAFFSAVPAASAILRAMQAVGLGYLTLSRAAASLSGGEAQRVKIAAHLAKVNSARATARRSERVLFVLDEPSAGLHFNEVDMLLQAIYRLRDAGHTILCIEHHAGMLACADYLVTLGPGAGEAGGRIVDTQRHFSESG